MSKNFRVIIVDQSVERRAEVQRTLALSRMAVLGEANYGIEAVSLARDMMPDAIVVAIDEPVVRPLRTIESLTDLLPQVPVIAYSSAPEADLIRRSMQSGARDFLTYPFQPEEAGSSLMTAIQQEERRRQRLMGISDETEAYGTVVTVFGAKGGIGKTTIATNLAVALAHESHQSVALIDVDTRFGDVAIMLDVPIERSIADLAHDFAPELLSKEIIQEHLYRHQSGVMVLPAPSRPTEWRSLQPEHLERIIALLARSYDYVVLDTPGTFNDLVGKALEAATYVLMITTVDMASVKDTLLALDMLDAWAFPKERIKLIVNHSSSSNTISETDLQRALEREIYWRIPYDRAVSSSAQLGMPVVLAKPDSRASRNLIQLAHTIAGVTEVRHNRGMGLLRRVMPSLLASLMSKGQE